MRIEIKNKVINGYNNEPITVDIFYNSNEKKKPVIIYAHGFNGFKDWGNFDMIASQFADAGFVFAKFNFSHNGTTPKSPEGFERLDLFGKNNYTIELFDLKQVIDFVMNEADALEIDKDELYLIGHSLGGGISIITASEDPRLKRLITWASV
jgi:dienelactone hydrolase